MKIPQGKLSTEMRLSFRSRSQSVIFPFLILFWSACGGNYHQDYFERTACIELPAGISDVEHFTGSDIAFTSHYTIPADSLEVVIARLELLPVLPDDWQPILFTEELSAPWNDIPEDGLILYCTGTNNWNSWDILLHTESAGLWITVYYTDAAGEGGTGAR